MGILYEKDVTLHMTFHIQVCDDALTQIPGYISSEDAPLWQSQLDEQSRLLQALLKQEATDLQQMFLIHIAWFLHTVHDTEWDQAVVGHLGFLDPSFRRGRLFSSTIATLSEEDQALWHERIEDDDPRYGNLFDLCTEDMDRCFQVRLKHIAPNV